MNKESILDKLDKDLPNKKRDVKDLIRYINTRADDNPNYILLLGAGCSVTSGIKSGQSLTDEWRKHIYLLHNKSATYDENKAIQWLKDTQSNWYNPAREYASLFEKMYDQPRQRRMFIETIVKDAFPSLGYAYLVKLISNKYFNAIFTTNFDDLINEAFYHFSDTRPIVCAHDSSINSVTLTSARPKIIKLHGDYLFDDIKATLRETESLEENIRNKFIEFVKEYGLIVVGYGGYDRSVMDVLYYLLKSENYFKHGIYWCLRDGDYINDDLRKLLWKDRVYYVKIEGFDELFADIFNHELPKSFPVDSNIFSDKITTSLNSFINNNSLINSNNPTIKDHLRRIKREQNSNDYFNTLKSIKERDFQRESKPDAIEAADLVDADIIFLVHLDKEIKFENYEKALKMSEAKLKENIHDSLKIRVLFRILDIYEEQEEKSKAINTCERLIDLEPKEPDFKLLKLPFIDNTEEKLKIIDDAISDDPYNYESYYEKANILIDMKKYCEEDNETYLDRILECLDRSMECNPNIKNPSFFKKILISTLKEKNEEKLKELIKFAENQNKYSWLMSKLIYELCTITKSTEYGNDNLIDIINNNKQNDYPKNQFRHIMIQFETLSYLNDTDSLHTLINEVDTNKRYENNSTFILTKTDAILDKLKDLNRAIALLEEKKDINDNSAILDRLFDLYLYDNRLVDAEELLVKYKQNFNTEEYHVNMHELYIAKKEYENAIKEVDNLKSIEFYEKKYLILIIYTYILMSDWQKANEIAKKFLDSVNHHPNYATEIINYQFSKTKIGKNVNKDKLNQIIQHAKSEEITAVCYILLDKSEDAYKIFKKLINEKYSRIYKYLQWPILVNLKTRLSTLKV